MRLGGCLQTEINANDNYSYLHISKFCLPCLHLVLTLHPDE